MAVVCAAGLMGLASCAKDEPPAPKQQAMSVDPVTGMTIRPGEAGGTIEETFTETATVAALDKASRRVTLATADGRKVSFTAGPEIRNFDQLKVGSKVKATLSEKLHVFVRGYPETPSITRSAEVGVAARGARPGVMIAESFELVAKVTAIDSAKRTATLQFAEGQTRVVTVRPDVDLSRYKVGDSLVVRADASLKVIVEAP